MKLSLPIIFSFFPFMGLCQETATDTIQKTTINYYRYNPTATLLH